MELNIVTRFSGEIPLIRFLRHFALDLMVAWLYRTKYGFPGQTDANSYFAIFQWLIAFEHDGMIEWFVE